MVFNTTFNNISATSWLSVVLVEETGVLEENHQPVTDKLDHIMLYRVHLVWPGWVVIGTDCIGSCKSNHHTVTTTTVPALFEIYLHGKHMFNIQWILHHFPILFESNTTYIYKMECHLYLNVYIIIKEI